MLAQNILTRDNDPSYGVHFDRPVNACGLTRSLTGGSYILGSFQRVLTSFGLTSHLVYHSQQAILTFVLPALLPAHPVGSIEFFGYVVLHVSAV